MNKLRRTLIILLSLCMVCCLAFATACIHDTSKDSSTSDGEITSGSSEDSSSSVEDPVDETAPVISLDCASEYLVALGSKWVIPVESISATDETDGEVEVSYSVAMGENEVPVIGNEFWCKNQGVYTVTVSAEDEAGNVALKAITVVTTNENEENNFDDYLRIANVKGKGITEVSLNTDPKYVKDGTGSAKLSLLSHTDVSWPGIIVTNLPINDISSYASISFWLYNDGLETVKIYLNRNETDSASFQLLPKVWTKIEITKELYDSVFLAKDGTAGGEPEVGIAEDLKTITFHMQKEAKTAAFDIYMDSLQVNPVLVNDVFDIEGSVAYPVVNVPYTLPELSVSLGGEAVEAQLSYVLYDANYNEIAVEGNTVTLTEKGRYNLVVTASANGISSSKGYMLVCSNQRDEDEILAFEGEEDLNFVVCEHMKLSITDEVYHEGKGSSSSLKIASCPSKWPYIHLGAAPHNDLDGVAYLYMWVKIDQTLEPDQKAYIGIKTPGGVKRSSVTNQWSCISWSVATLREWGITCLDDILITVEKYDPDGENNEGGWCAISFNTYIDDFRFLKEEADPENYGKDILNFNSYREADPDYIRSNGYTSYNFSDSRYILPGHSGSLQFSAPSSKWPSFYFGSALSGYELDDISGVELEIYATNIPEGGFLRMAANDREYQYIREAYKWTTITLPVAALRYYAASNTTYTNLADIYVPVSANNGSEYINVGTFYIGRISIVPKASALEDFEGEDAVSAITGDDNVTVSVNTKPAYVSYYGGNASIKLSSESASYAITLNNAGAPAPATLRSLTFSVYVDADLTEENKVAFTIGEETHYVAESRKWVKLTYAGASLGSSLNGLTVNVSRADGSNLETVYVDCFTYEKLGYEELKEVLLAQDIIFDGSMLEEASVFTASNSTPSYNSELGVAQISTTVTWPGFYVTTGIDISAYKYMWLDVMVVGLDGYEYTEDDQLGIGINDSFKDLVAPNTWFKWIVPVNSSNPLTENYYLGLRRKRNGVWIPVDSKIYIKRVGLYKDNPNAEAAFVGDFESKDDVYGFSSSGNMTMWNNSPEFAYSGNGSLVVTSYNRWPSILITPKLLATMDANGYTSLTFKFMVVGSKQSNIARTEKWGSRSSIEAGVWYEATVSYATVKAATEANTAMLQVNLNAASYIQMYVDDITFA